MQGVLGKGLDELQDICVPARLFYLVVSDLLVRFDSAEEDVESNSAGVERGLLRNQCHVLAEFLYVQFRERMAVELGTSAEKVASSSRTLTVTLPAAGS